MEWYQCTTYTLLMCICWIHWHYCFNKKMFVTPLLHRKCPPSAMWCMRLRHTDRRRKSLGQEVSFPFLLDSTAKKMVMLDVFLISDQSAVGEILVDFVKISTKFYTPSRERIDGIRSPLPVLVYHGPNNDGDHLWGVAIAINLTNLIQLFT